MRYIEIKTPNRDYQCKADKGEFVSILDNGVLLIKRPVDGELPDIVAGFSRDGWISFDYKDRS